MSARPEVDMPRITDARSLAAGWRLATGAVSLVLGFFLPFSSAGVAIALAALLVLVLLRPALLIRSAPWRHPVLAVGLALFVYIALHTGWSTGWSPEAIGAVNRYHELLLCPVVFVVMRDARNRRLLAQGLLTGLLVLSLGYWLAFAWPGVLPVGTGELSARRISAGFAFAVTALLLVLSASRQRAPWGPAVMAAWFAATVLVAMDGRTGQLLVLTLGVYAAWTLFAPPVKWVSAVAVPGLALALAFTSPGFQTRLHETIRGEALVPGKELNSTTIRIQFARMAAELAREHWVAGVGYANYGRVHEKAVRQRYAQDPVRSTWLDQPWVRTPNPHNEYVMQLVGGGIVALALYVTWLGLAFRTGQRALRPEGPMLAGMVFAFAAGSLFNSMLMDFIEGHLFMVLLAALLAAAQARTAAR